MSLPTVLQDREFAKFTEVGGQVAIRVTSSVDPDNSSLVEGVSYDEKDYTYNATDTVIEYKLASVVVMTHTIFYFNARKDQVINETIVRS